MKTKLLFIILVSLIWSCKEKPDTTKQKIEESKQETVADNDTMRVNKQEAKKVGDQLGISWEEVSLDEFTIGFNVEFEHGTRFPETNVTNDDKIMTAKIAWMHLKEVPDYYTRLEKMEKKAKEYWQSKLRK